MKHPGRRAALHLAPSTPQQMDNKVTIYIIRRVNGRAVIADRRHVLAGDLNFFITTEPGDLDRLTDYNAARRACRRYNNQF